MSALEIARLYENLSLAEEDGVVLEMSEETSIDGVKDVNRCLVGKVLSYKKVNREAFKGLIEQIWSPFGQVEVESVGDNLFMFYFNNGEDRNRVLQRGPWHFGNSLIVLEKSTGEGNVSKLGFNRADFWVQIHDIPILCMNRRTAKWLAKQIGEVVEIPSESRECWGKFMWVKVRIDILKPLKRWLKLKIGQTDEVTLVSLKYEKLPDFCYACGRMGYGMKECLDEEARKMALEGPLTRFGSWLKATALDKSKPRLNSQGNGSSSDRARSSGTSHDIEGDNSISHKPGYLIPQRREVSSPVTAKKKKKMIEEKPVQTLQPVCEDGPPKTDDMWVDGLGREKVGSRLEMGPPNSDSIAGPSDIVGTKLSPSSSTSILLIQQGSSM
ncbi:hypothetical protein EZV62_022545 [Acer yangbiense]|uniref:CCHC-type domain-containing protein n=1 Tax=Acer yangbiense TaxID=1000413 RepID=A0A5C7HB59_9ROSI|nr:hypothetical protein EZV62_022545 [Acer yangbiense]